MHGFSFHWLPAEQCTGMGGGFAVDVGMKIVPERTEKKEEKISSRDTCIQQNDVLLILSYFFDLCHPSGHSSETFIVCTW